MTDFVLFMLFGSLEVYAILLLGFVTFKIDLYHLEFVFVGLICTYFSYNIRYGHQLPDLDTVIQFLLICCFVWLLFRVHIFYAVILSALAYQAYAFIQIIIVYFFNVTSLFSSEMVYGTGLKTYVMQVVTATTAFCIAYWIKNRRKGFDFIPDKQYANIKISKRDIYLMIVTLTTLAIVFVYAKMIINEYIFLLLIINALALYTFIQLAYRKDRNA